MKAQFIDINTISTLSDKECSIIFKLLFENFNKITKNSLNYISSDTRNDIISSIQRENIYEYLDNKIIFSLYNQHKEIMGISYYSNTELITIDGLYSSFHILDHNTIKDKLFNFMLSYIINKEETNKIYTNNFNSELDFFISKNFIKEKDTFNYSFLNNFTYPSQLLSLNIK